MKASRLSAEQIIQLWQWAERDEQPIGVLCREQGISEQTCYRWRQKVGGLTVPDTQRWRGLAKKTIRLKRLLAARDLEVDALKALRATKS